MVRALNDLEVNGVALERAQEFTVLPSEVPCSSLLLYPYHTSTRTVERINKVHDCMVSNRENVVL